MGLLEKRFINEMDKIGLPNTGKILTRMKERYAEIDSEAEFGITVKLADATETEDYSNVRNDILSAVGSETMLDDTGSRLILRAKAAQEKAATDPTFKFDLQSAKMTLRKHFDLEGFAVKMDFNSEASIAAKQNWSKFYGLLADGMSPQVAVKKVLEDSKVLSGRVRVSSSVTGKVLDDPEKINEAVVKTQKLNKAGRLSDEQYYILRKEAIDAKKQLDLNDELEKMNLIPYLIDENPQQGTTSDKIEQQYFRRK
jgi:hypothetical protein